MLFHLLFLMTQTNTHASHSHVCLRFNSALNFVWKLSLAVLVQLCHHIKIDIVRRIYRRVRNRFVGILCSAITATEHHHPYTRWIITETLCLSAECCRRGWLALLLLSIIIWRTRQDMAGTYAVRIVNGNGVRFGIFCIEMNLRFQYHSLYSFSYRRLTQFISIPMNLFRNGGSISSRAKSLVDDGKNSIENSKLW